MNKITVYRKQLDMSMHELARRTNLTASYISNLESGNRKNPSKEKMERIANALGKTVTEVFFPDESEVS